MPFHWFLIKKNTCTAKRYKSLRASYISLITGGDLDNTEAARNFRWK